MDSHGLLCQQFATLDANHDPEEFRTILFRDDISGPGLIWTDWPRRAPGHNISVEYSTKLDRKLTHPIHIWLVDLDLHPQLRHNQALDSIAVGHR